MLLYYEAASRILTYPGEYDNVIPEDISLAEYILNEIEKFGDDIYSVGKHSHFWNLI